MAYCRNCGTKLIDGTKFCPNCGYPSEGKNTEHTQREQLYAGKLYKCPRCGEVLNSFELNCPACGYELRGAKVLSAVKEFALKLEAIESRREYEKPRGFFAAAEAFSSVSKTDEQKISLIKSFSVPNTKEDMLEFMILATSSINMRIYDSTNTNVSKGEKEINAAWFSKVQQVYEKAKRIYSQNSIFEEIQALYDSCNAEIKKSKKKGIIKWGLMFGWIPIVLVIIIALAIVDEHKEIKRLGAIVVEVQDALENSEYKLALNLADSIDYQLYDVDMERKWDIEREYWVDKVLEEAKANGMILEYTPTQDVDKANDEQSDSKDTGGGFDEGFKDGIQSGLDEAKEYIDEFSNILNGKE